MNVGQESVQHLYKWDHAIHSRTVCPLTEFNYIKNKSGYSDWMGHLSSYLSTAAPDQWLHELAVLVCVKKAGVNQ